MAQGNGDLALTIIAIAFLSFSGWLIFNGLNGLFPQLQSLSPIMKIVVGFIGIFAIVKLGLRKLS